MKKILIFIIIIIFPVKAEAVTPSPVDVTATPSAEVERIERIKELVASKVAELKLIEKRGILGTVRDASTTQMTLDDNNKTKRIIDIDELTKFSDPSKKDFGISDIIKGDLISSVGLYNKELKRLLARTVTKIKTQPIQYEGVVMDKDRTEFVLTVRVEDGKTITVDIESNTKTQVFEKATGLTKSGFTKILPNQRVLVSGYPTLNENNKIAASRIIHFADVPPSSKMKPLSSENNQKDQL